MSVIPVGAVAPRFKLPSSTGESIELAKVICQGPVVLYFYTRADTPGCTAEACGFRDALSEFAKINVSILGISPDSIEAATRFAKKFHLNFPLLADEKHDVAKRYGVWQQKSMFGHKYWGVARTTFVVGKDVRVIHVFQRVRPKGHEAAVLKWLLANR